jgi:short-subunit dehydrogenase
MPKTVLIIGAGPGIGLETARRFGREGYSLVLASRSPEKLADQLSEMRASGSNVTVEAVDASDGPAVTALVKRYADRLDVMLYNAAAIVFGPTIDQVAPESFDADIQVDLSSALRAIQAVLPGMTANRKGTILLTGGGLADYPNPMAVTLSAGKAGLRAAGQALFEPMKAQGLQIATITIMATVVPGSEEAQGIAEMYWQITNATTDAWTYEHSYSA